MFKQNRQRIARLEAMFVVAERRAGALRSLATCIVLQFGPFFNDCTSMKLSETQRLHIGTYIVNWLHYLICLPWGAVDWDHNQIHLTTIKTGRVLHIPLANPLRSLLKALKVKAGKVGPSDPIWPDQAEEYQIQDARGFSQAFYEQIFISVRTGTPARWQAEESGSGGEQCYLSQLAAHVCKFVKGNRQFPICGQGIGRSFKRPGERSLYARARRGSGQGDQSVALVRLRQ